MNRSILGLLCAFSSGVIFSLGLVLGGMTNPEYVQGFLNIGGIFFPKILGFWYPRLAFVMLGAITIMIMVFYWSRKHGRKPLFHERYEWPTQVGVDRALIIGAALFGVGWGIIGYCPGPALANLANGGITIIVFILFMLIGLISGKALKSHL